MDYKFILHLGHYRLSDELIVQGVRPPINKKEVMELLEFKEIPSTEILELRSKRLGEIAAAAKCDAVLIGCLPFMSYHLEKELTSRGIKYLYIFSEKIIDNRTGNITHKFINFVE